MSQQQQSRPEQKEDHPYITSEDAKNISKLFDTGLFFTFRMHCVDMGQDRGRRTTDCIIVGLRRRRLESAGWVPFYCLVRRLSC